MKLDDQKMTILTDYHQLTISLLNCLTQGNEEELAPLLETREECIHRINQLDKAAGTILMNPNIKQQLEEIMKLEEQIKKQMEQSVQRLANRVRMAKNEQYLSKHYDESIPVSKGLFYDKSK
jgi:hypothetical protein